MDTLRSCASSLHIQIDHLQRVVLDEFGAGLDDVAHQGLEDLAGLVGVLDLDLVEAADLGVVSQSCSGFISPSPL